MAAYKYRYVFTDHKPAQAWMNINRLWGKCWCGRLRESFEHGRRTHCSKLHADWWRFYICRDWSAVRCEILERDLYMCQTCGISNQYLDIDHIIPKSLGGDDWNPDNLQVLCKPCHESKSLQDNRLFLSHSKSYGTHSIMEWIE